MDTITPSPREWTRMYGQALTEMLRRFRQTFAANIKVVVLWDDSRYVRKLLEKIDEAYGEDAKFIFALPDLNRVKDLIEEYDTSCIGIPIKITEIGNGIQSDLQFLGIESESIEGIQLPHHDSCDGIIRPSLLKMMEEHFQVVHKKLANEEPDNLDDFYLGEQISWYGLKRNLDIRRTKTKLLYRKIEEKLRIGQKDLIELVHMPGMGGSTLARRLAWEIHDEFPTLILKDYVEQHTADIVKQVYDITKKTVFVVIEAHLIGMENAYSLFHSVSSQTRPVVFLVIRRGSRAGVATELISHLDSDEAKDFYDGYMAQLSKKPYDIAVMEKKKYDLNEVYESRDHNKLNPFYMGLLVHEEEFLGLSDYIRRFVETLTAQQKLIVLYLSLAYYYVGRSLPSNFFRRVLHMADEKKKLPEHSDLIRLKEYLPEEIGSIIISEKQGRQTFWRPRHFLIAKEMMIQILSGVSQDKNAWKLNLSSYAIKFIEDSIPYGAAEQSEYVMQVIVDLFVRRNNRDIKDKQFASLIMDIDQSESRELIFQKLIECYPTEPHFYAHLARYYSFFAKDRERAIQYADEALRLNELQDDKDALLYHIKGMCIREDVYEVINKLERLDSEKDEFLFLFDQLKQKVGEAAQYFKNSRDLNNDTHGYVAHIQMLIQVVDFGYRKSGVSKEEFLKRNIDTWYGDCIDMAEHLLENAKRLYSEDDEDSYISECSNGLFGLYGDFSTILQNWNNIIQKVKDKPRIRREIVRAYQRRDNDFALMNEQTLQRIIQLMEENILEEPDNEKNIYLWFQAARHSKQINLDNAIEKLSRWKTITNSLETTYYFYILKVFKALLGHSIAAQEANRLMEECSKRSLHIAYRTTCHEWLGSKSGLQAMVHKSEVLENKVFNPSKLKMLKGIISEYIHPGNGTIEIEGMKVFFQPSLANEGEAVTENDVNKEVYFYLGFSYDGLRVDNKSVRTVDYVSKKPKETMQQAYKEIAAVSVVSSKAKESELEIKEGETVDCIVTKVIPNRAFVKILGSSKKGSIHIREIANQFVSNIREFVDEGQQIKAVALNDDPVYGWNLSLKAHYQDGAETTKTDDPYQNNALKEQMKKWLKEGKDK